MTIPAARTPRQVQQQLLSEGPDGWAFSRDLDDYEPALFLPAATELSLIEASALSMLPQIDPRTAPNLLPDWERVLGPDPCQAAYPITDTVTRGLIAFERLTNRGTICAGYFERYALSIGETITIEEFPASVCGMSKCGDSLNPPPGQCDILVTLGSVEVVTAICGISTCGDSLGTFDRSVMECVIRQGVPLYVTPYFSYTG
jgi:uncharacterized protein YmfQ (DUF2313 family)